jgi:hypothetical protein
MFAVDDDRSAIRPAVPPGGNLLRVTADRTDDDHPLVGPRTLARAGHR